MVNRRARPYFIGGGIIAVLSLSYIGIRAYKSQVELDELLADARAANRSVGTRHSHSSDNHAHEHHGDPLTTATQHEHNHAEGHEGNTYEIDGMSLHVTEVIAPMRMSREDSERAEWIVYGKLTPYIEQEIKNAKLLRQQNEGRVLQHVITPDGKLGTVAVDKDDPIEEGDVILQSDLISRSHPWGFSENQIEVNQMKAKRSEESKYIKDGVEYPIPDEFFALDEYERMEYFKKFRLTLDLGISMDEVETKIAAGEFDASLTDAEKKRIEARLSIDAALLEEKKHRMGLLDPLGPKPTLSDLPPVNVTIKPDAEYGHTLPESRSHIDDYGFWESVLADVETASDEKIDEPPPTFKTVPELPISTPQVNRDPDVENSVPMAEVPPMPENLTPETAKAKLKERLSPEQFLKAQQLLDEYGAEVGIRQFREMSPEHKGAPQHPDEKRR